MTPFTIHYHVARWSFMILPILTFPYSLTSLPSICTLLLINPSVDWIVRQKRYGRKNGCSFDLYKRGTYTVFPIPDCSVHHPSINLAVEALTVATTDMQTALYNKYTSNGGLC